MTMQYTPHTSVGESEVFPLAMQPAGNPFGLGSSLCSSLFPTLTIVKASKTQFKGDVLLRPNVKYNQGLYKQVYECECCGTAHSKYFCPTCGSSRKSWTTGTSILEAWMIRGNMMAYELSKKLRPRLQLHERMGFWGCGFVMLFPFSFINGIAIRWECHRSSLITWGTTQSTHYDDR